MNNFWNTHKTCGEISCDECDGRYQRLYEAAQAVVDRWDTPLWKDVPATAEYINALRMETTPSKVLTKHDAEVAAKAVENAAEAIRNPSYEDVETPYARLRRMASELRRIEMSEFEPKNAAYYKRELLKERIKHAEIVRLARAYVDAAASSASWEEIGRITIELRDALK